jgi:hypothetical protein
MGEDLFRLISTGLLGVIVLLLLMAVSQLGRLQRALGERGEKASTGTDLETSSERSEASPAIDEPVASAAPEPEVVVDTGSPVTSDQGEAGAPDEEGPFEKDGRWWFRRDGDLLVYDEQLEEWVDPATTSAAAPGSAGAATTAEPDPVAAEAAPEIEPHPLDEAREWDGRDTREPATETIPVAGTTSLEEASPAPIPEPVSAPAPITQTSEGGQEQAEGGTHWKCPSCGVINGSTASSCRMCFAARP